TGDADVCQNGTLTLTGSGAADLSWNGGAYGAVTTYDVTTTTSGTQDIKLKVRDANLCESAEVTKTITVNELPTVSIVSQTDNINCDAPYTGQFELQGSNGTMPYIYWVDGVDNGSKTLYDNIQSTNSISYVVDDNGCKSDDITVEIHDNSLPITVDFTATASNGGNYCEGTGGVDITVSATQLNVTYTLFKDNVAVNSLAGTESPITFSSNEEGSYKVEATSTGNCKRDMNNALITVTEYARPVVLSVEPSPIPTCAEEELTFTASSDMTGVSYIWTYAGYTATEIDDKLIIDPTVGGVTYSGTVKAMKDACESVADFPYSYSVALKPVLSIVLSNPSTGGLLTSPATITCTDPIVRATLSGGYRYEWLDTHQVNPVRDLTAANIYNVMAFDINGCPSDISTVEIISDQDKPKDLLITPSILDATLTCLNQTMTLTASSSTPNVTYLWNDDLQSTTATINVTKSRIYQVTVIGQNGCTENVDILVSQNKILPQLSVSSTSDKLTCTTTSIQLTGVIANESEVGTPIVYEWLDDPNLPQSRTITIQGTYSLRATAANGCISESSMQITEDKVLPKVWIELLTDTLTCNHPSILLTAKSDVPVTYEWDDLSVGDTYTATEARIYTVKGTALNGCEAQNDTTLQDATASPNIEITADSPVVTCKSVILTATGGVIYEWSDGSTSSTLEITDGGNYSVEGTNRYGCTSTAQISMTEDKTNPTVSLTPTRGTLTCTDPALTVTSVGTPATVSYMWNDGVNTATRTITIKGTYTVTVTNPDNECTRTASLVVSENKAKPMLEIVDLPQVCLPAEIDLSDAIGSNTIADNIAYYEDELLTKPIIDTRITVSSQQLYYAQGISVNNSGCVGDAEPIAINIKAMTTKPVVNNYDECTRKGSKSLTELVTLPYQTLRFYDTEVGGQPRSTIIDASQSNTTTSYWVSDAHAGLCESERTEIVVHIEGEIDYDLTSSSDKVLAGKDEVTITATATSESAATNSYNWKINGVSVEESSDTYTEYPYVNTVYELSASGRCNTVVKSVSVEAKWQTAITPENNGKNDVFAKGYHITVFNRYSEKVFEGDDGWDGIVDSKFAKKGIVAEPGVYYYYINLPNGTVQRATIEVVKF
ncbi:MAG: hypothetical protein EOL95_06020, partial [Bacteroidia bacterium]|nr:hypothetical protein [Bacteroidia bacterium]